MHLVLLFYHLYFRKDPTKGLLIKTDEGLFRTNYIPAIFLGAWHGTEMNH